MCVVVSGWEDEDVLIVGYTREPAKKRRKVTDQGVCVCYGSMCVMALCVFGLSVFLICVCV